MKMLTMREAVENTERQQMTRLWRICKGNISQIADISGLSVPTVRQRAKAFGLYEPLRRGK